MFFFLNPREEDAMSSEIGAVDFDGYDVEFVSLCPPQEESNSAFHESIFSEPLTSRPLAKTVVPGDASSNLVSRTQQVAQTQGAYLGARLEGSGEVGGRWRWGGPDGNQFSGYVKGEVRDDKGNSAQVQVTQNSDGTGEAAVSARHSNNENPVKK
jgi:hypothetical protein